MQITAAPARRAGDQAAQAVLQPLGASVAEARERDRLVDRAALLSMRRAEQFARNNAPAITAEAGLIVTRWRDCLRERAEMTAGSTSAESAAWDEACAASEQLGLGVALTGFFRRCSQHLPELMTGVLTVQALLFDDDTDAITADIYQQNPASCYTNHAAAQVIRGHLLRGRDDARQQPAVLEVGAGTGATTDYVLDALTDVPALYHFTDIGTWFARQALLRYAGRAGFSSAVLDLNDTSVVLPTPRFAPALSRPVVASSVGARDVGWDVIVASNVLHNAHHVTECLRRLRGACVPGGLLVMIETEVEHLPLLVSMRFMMSSNEFMDPEDPRRGAGRMFLTTDEWVGAFERAGWQPEDVLPGVGHELTEYGQHVYVARNPD